MRDTRLGSHGSGIVGLRRLAPGGPSCFLSASLAWLSLVLVYPTAPVLACDLPVYEYTIRMWQRDPYQVWYFYRQTEDAADVGVNKYLAQIDRKSSTVNLAFDRVDVASLSSGKPGSLREWVWSRNKSRRLPFHVVLTPRRTELFVGRMDLPTAKALIQSPKRTELAKQLSGGKQGLLLLLLGPKQSENAAAREVVRDVLAESKKEDLDVGLLEVNRDSAEERWLVEQVLQLEDDLKDLDNTMLFGVFGRGHVLEPFVGKGINKDNLRDLVAFINGPCSCEVKTSGFGMDLLTNWDWAAGVSDWPDIEEIYFDDTTAQSGETTAPVATVTGSSSDVARAPEPKPQAAGSDAKGPSSVSERSQTKSVAATSRSRSTQQRKAREKAVNTAAGAPSTSNEPAVAEQTAKPGSAVSEEERGPRLPEPAETNGPGPADGKAQLSSIITQRLGLTLSVAATLAALGGLAVIWLRREQ